MNILVNAHMIIRERQSLLSTHLLCQCFVEPTHDEEGISAILKRAIILSDTVSCSHVQASTVSLKMLVKSDIFTRPFKTELNCRGSASAVGFISSST